VAGLKDEPGVSGVVSYLECAIRSSWAKAAERLFWWDSRRPRVRWSRSFPSFTSWQLS
jgi:hypothetical protein